MDFAVLPPEVDSGRRHAGVDSEPLLAAAAAWDESAVHSSAARLYQSEVTQLSGEGWMGPVAAATAVAATRYAAWTNTTAIQAEPTANQVPSAVAAYQTTFSATVPSPMIAADQAHNAHGQGGLFNVNTWITDIETPSGSLASLRAEPFELCIPASLLIGLGAPVTTASKKKMATAAAAAAGLASATEVPGAGLKALIDSSAPLSDSVAQASAETSVGSRQAVRGDPTCCGHATSRRPEQLSNVGAAILINRRANIRPSISVINLPRNRLPGSGSGHCFERIPQVAAVRRVHPDTASDDSTPLERDELTGRRMVTAEPAHGARHSHELGGPVDRRRDGSVTDAQGPPHISPRFAGETP